MRSVQLLALVPLLAAPALAQTPAVSPLPYTNQAAPEKSFLLFSGSPVTFLQVHDDVPSGQITSIAFRAEDHPVLPPVAFSATLSVWMSTGAGAIPASPPAPGVPAVSGLHVRPVFADNHGPDLIEVIPSTTFNFPGGVSTGPADFTHVLPLQTPFDYDSTLGPLVWEVRISANTGRQTFMDYISTEGQNTWFGPALTYPGKSFATQFRVEYRTNPDPSGNHRFRAIGFDFGDNVSGVWMIGFDNTQFGGLPLPLDLGIFGVPGQTLLVSPRLQVPFTTSPQGLVSPPVLPLPKSPLLRLIPLYSQVWTFDPNNGFFFSEANETFAPAQTDVGFLWEPGTASAVDGSVLSDAGFVTRFEFN